MKFTHLLLCLLLGLGMALLASCSNTETPPDDGLMHPGEFLINPTSVDFFDRSGASDGGSSSTTPCTLAQSMGTLAIVRPMQFPEEIPWECPSPFINHAHRAELQVVGVIAGAPIPPQLTIYTVADIAQDVTADALYIAQRDQQDVLILLYEFEGYTFGLTGYIVGYDGEEIYPAEPLSRLPGTLPEMVQVFMDTDINFKEQCPGETRFSDAGYYENYRRFFRSDTQPQCDSYDPARPPTLIPTR